MPLAAVLTLGLLFSGPSAEDVQGAVRKALDDPAIQREYPAPRDGSGTGGTDVGPDHDRGRAAHRPPADEVQPSPRDSARSRGNRGVGWLQGLLWTAIVVGVLLFVAWIVRRAGGYVGDERVAAQAPAPAAPATRPSPTADAEALARAGRYDEAVHVLLLLALAQISRHASLATSLTSHEAIDGAGLDPTARDDVDALVDAVEVSLFGGRPLDRARYEACADRYRRFAASETSA